MRRGGELRGTQDEEQKEGMLHGGRARAREGKKRRLQIKGEEGDLSEGRGLRRQ